MAKILQHCFFLPFFFILLTTQCSKGDVQLINQLCQKTQSQSFCKDCLLNYIGSEFKTAKQLAGITLGCAEKAGIAVLEDLVDCAMNGQTVAFREDCNKCQDFMFPAQKDLTAARKTYTVGSFKQSADSVKLALDQYRQCTKEFGIGLLPKPLAPDLLKFQGYSESATEMLSQI